MRKKNILKVKNSLLELQKLFIELKDRVLKDWKIIIKREIKKLFFKPVTVSIEIDDMDKFEQKGMKNKKPIMKTLVWLVNWLYSWAYNKTCNCF